MNIRNNISSSLRDKIRKCINLLDVEYKTLNYTIDFYTTRERLERERLSKPDLDEASYNQILNGETETSAITLGGKKEIKIFLFMYDDPESDFSEFIKLISKVYHEIRHAWQYTHHLYEDEQEIQNVDANWEEYLKLPSEKDAYKFEEHQMNHHCLKMSEILGIGKFNYMLKKEISDIIHSS